MIRVALYARYSSDNQRDASIEDQLRLCRQQAERQGWTVVDSYADRALSGASLLRPGIQDLMADAQRGRFAVILTEALDRLSRDQEDIAGLFKRMAFGGVRIVTLSEGEIGQLHVGLKGTMNALFLQDLADKTRRGLRGRVEAGKAGGGLCYGYRVVRAFDAGGAPLRGEREIVPEEAATIRRIFAAYAAGQSSRTIAHALNAEAVPGPFGRAWGPSTIHGSAKRRNGILNNELYVGRLVWNRQRFLKDPDSGKRVSRPNPEAEWITQDVPALRIVDDALWETVKARQGTLTLKTACRADAPLLERRRPKHLFAGLVKCGCCDGGYAMISATLLGCATARDKNTCANRLNIRRDVLEASVLDGLRAHLMEPDLFAAFCAEFTTTVNRQRMQASAGLDAERKELARVTRDLDRAIQAILDGVPGAQLKDRIGALEARKTELTERLADAREPPPLLHPNMAEMYRRKVTELAAALGRPESRLEAAELLRTLVERIVLTPEAGTLAITLRGDLAGILALAEHKTKKPGSNKGTGLVLLAQESLVAGARNHRGRHSLMTAV